MSDRHETVLSPDGVVGAFAAAHHRLGCSSSPVAESESAVNRSN